MSKRRLMYIELKTGYSDNGPAWISNVTFSKSGETIYFNGMALKKMRKGGIAGNFLDLESRDEYWVSGVKKTGTDRHWAGSGKIQIDANALSEFLQHTGQRELDSTQYEITYNIIATDPQKFYELENQKF
ncbi:MAG: hypothetical protein AB1489_30030 [Acidobacteriota bacterium]